MRDRKEIMMLLADLNESANPEKIEAARKALAEELPYVNGLLVHKQVPVGAPSTLILSWSEVLAKRLNGNDAGGRTAWKSLGLRATPSIAAPVVGTTMPVEDVVVTQIRFGGHPILYTPRVSREAGVPINAGLLSQAAQGFRADTEQVEVEVLNRGELPMTVVAMGMLGDRTALDDRPGRLFRWVPFVEVAEADCMEAVLTVHDLGVGNCAARIEIVLREDDWYAEDPIVEHAEVYVGGERCPINASDRCLWDGPGSRCITPSGVLARVPLINGLPPSQVYLLVETCPTRHPDRY